MMTSSSRGRQANRPEASPRHLGHLSQALLGFRAPRREGTAFSWQMHPPQGLALLPGLMGSAEWINPEVKQEGPSLGLCPLLPPGLLGSSDAEVQLVLLYLRPDPPPPGPWTSGLSDHQSTLKKPEANPGELGALLAQVGPGPSCLPSSWPSSSRPSQRALCAVSHKAACSQPAGGVGS